MFQFLLNTLNYFVQQLKNIHNRLTTEFTVSRSDKEQAEALSRFWGIPVPLTQVQHYADRAGVK